VIDTRRAEPEDVQLWDEDRIRAWQDYHLSGMPQLLSSMNLCHALLALNNSGILDRLRAGAGAVAAAELLEGLDPEVGAGFLRYLVTCGVLEEHGGRHRLTRRGELLTGDVALARLGFYLEAYGPVTGRMTDLLTGRATYGLDVTRAAGALSRHSGTVSTSAYTLVVLEALRSSGASRLLDLGCGGGSLLVELCQARPDLTGVGIDIAPEAIEAARRLADRTGLAGRVEFAVADAFDPSSWPASCASVDVICGVGVLHEQFRDGDQAVIDILDRYATVVGGEGEKRLLIGEPELRYDNQENDSDFFLVHFLTAQGIPRGRPGWLDVFERTSLRCRRVYSNAVAGPRTVFYELVPREG
jgi:SAM-dependent methyltransferase